FRLAEREDGIGAPADPRLVYLQPPRALPQEGDAGTQVALPYVMPLDEPLLEVPIREDVTPRARILPPGVVEDDPAALAVPGRPPHFLGVGQQVAWGAVVDDQADVGLVDTHAEALGGNHDPVPGTHERALLGPAVAAGHVPERPFRRRGPVVGGAGCEQELP